MNTSQGYDQWSFGRMAAPQFANQTNAQWQGNQPGMAQQMSGGFQQFQTSMQNQGMQNNQQVIANYV